MLVVLLTHPGDRQLTVQLCDHIRFLGNVSRHECLIVSPNGTDMRGIEDVLREAFGNVHTYQYPATMSGWPYGPNEAAAQAMMHVWANPALLYHYLMLEPDCVPRDAHWLDYADNEYRRSGTAITGTKIDTVEVDTKRVVGKHVIGVAVYPKNFPKLCPLVRSLTNMTMEYYRKKAMPPPWDAYFGPYTVRMTTETSLIQHLLRVRKVEPNGRVWWDCPSLQNAISQVRPDAVLIHGSKDPAFLPAITGRKPDANVPRQEQGHDRQEHPRVPSGEIVRQNQEPPRESGREQGRDCRGDVDGEQKPLTTEQKREERSRKRNYAALMEIRKEYGFEAMPLTPEFTRSAYFAVEMPWPKFRAYASKLGAQGFGKGNTKGEIINRVIAIEKEQRKEPWTKDLPKIVPQNDGQSSSNGSVSREQNESRLQSDASVRGLQNQPKKETGLPTVQGTLQPGMEKVPRVDAATAEEGKRAAIRLGLFAEGQTPEETLRTLWGREISDASPELRQAIERSMVVPGVPSGVAQGAGSVVAVENAPPIPIGSLPQSHGVKTTVEWHPVDPVTGNPIPQPSSGDGLSEMQRKMLALRQQRQSVLAGAPHAA